jgi:metal-responsive CopG/Arc/MetJ family transcriptional regulator
MVEDVARKQVLVQLDDVQVAALDRIVGADSSRSELIREAVDLYLRAVDERLQDLRYAEAYRLAPENLDDDAALRALQAWPEP